MKTKIIFILILLTLLSFLSVNLVHASLADVKYPVTELGNCNTQQECETYCDNPENIEVCLNFAEKNGLMSQDEIAEARKFMPLIQTGDTPGGCKGKRECETYCDNDANLNECIEFAKKAGVIDEKEYEMVKKTGGIGPGGCKGKRECDSFCEKEENFPTCIDFAKANGLISDEDYEMAKKTGGKGPGGCKGKEACDAFCDNPDNQETCTNFAIEHNLLSGEELENMKKNQEFMNSAEGKCSMECFKEAGIDSKVCGKDGTGPEACKICGDKCFRHDETSEGRCLSQESWKQLDSGCKAKGSGYHLEDVKGDNGQGGECVVDMKCVYSSGEEWESQEEKDRKLADMQKQWDEENAQHESQYGPGTQGTEVYTGGCTEPGPEGQCGPRDQIGQAQGEQMNPTTQTDQAGQISQQEQQPQENSPSSGGESSPTSITGEVILEENSNNNLLIKIFKWIFRI